MAGPDVEYLLSCYLTPPGDLAVLLPRHDQNVSLWRRTDTTVELVRLWELERLSGQKHHHWPLFTVDRTNEFLDALMREEGLSLEAVSTIWGVPGLDASTPLTIPDGAEDFPIHSLAHLFSGLLMDTELFRSQTIIAMAVDSAPDFALETTSKPFWYAGCVADRGRIMFAPVESPAPLYTASQQLFDSEPGTLMALATACDTRILVDAGAGVADLRLFGGSTHPVSTALPFVESLVATAEHQLAGRELDPRFTRAEHLRSAVMKVVQRCCELIAVRDIERLCELGGVRPQDCYLSTSGGFALNCPTNSVLVNEMGFRGLLTPPCANDSGQSYGLGLLGLHGLSAVESADHRLRSAYHGTELTDVDGALTEFAPWIESVEEFSPERFTADLIDAPVAWVDGAAEIGPRALCHRSLLGDPRSARTKDVLNQHKLRQWWRPVAPVVLEEYTGEWFEQGRPSPYMLETTRVRSEVAAQVPAILHLDGTARHQTLSAQVNPRLYQAIDAFRAVTGVPLICNTSLNDKGEPIVNTTAEALTFCVRKGVKVLYLEGRRISLRSKPVPPADRPAAPRSRRIALFAGQEEQRDALWRAWIDRGYSEEAMFLMTQLPELRAGSAAADPGDANDLADHIDSTDASFGFWVKGFRDDFGPGTAFGDRGSGRPPG